MTPYRTIPSNEEPQVLDKFLKDKSTAEQRQQNALSWLEQLKQGEVA